MSIRGCGRSGRPVILVAGIALSTSACSVCKQVAPAPPRPLRSCGLVQRRKFLSRGCSKSRARSTEEGETVPFRHVFPIRRGRRKGLRRSAFGGVSEVRKR